MDLVERDNAFELSAEMPELDEKNIEVNVVNGVLTVKGHKEEDKAEKKEDFHLRERRFGSFVRSVRLPGERGCRADRSRLQERRSQSNPAEETRGPDASQEDRGQRRLRPIVHDGRRVLALSAAT